MRCHTLAEHRLRCKAPPSKPLKNRRCVMTHRSVNKVIVLGHLGRDADTKFTPSGVAVTKFSVATSRRWKGQPVQRMERRNRLAQYRSVAVGEPCQLPDERQTGVRR